MWSCNPGIWPVLVQTNKYSKARNREARRVESRRGEARRIRAERKAPLFPPYGARFLNHIHAIPLGRSAHRNARMYALVIVRASQRGLMRINSRRQNHEQSAAAGGMRPISSGHTSRATTRLQRESERASKRCNQACAFSYSPRESREK